MRGLVVLGQQLRRSEFEIHLADRAGEGEWHLVVGVVHRRARVGADVEGLVERQKDRSGIGRCSCSRPPCRPPSARRCRPWPYRGRRT